MHKINYLQPRFVAACLSTLTVATASHADLTIEEIIVTSQKRPESMQDVPVAVSALGTEALEGLKLRDTTEIATQVPNMQISTPLGDSMPVIAMRGISMDDYSLNQSSPVGIYIDEIYKGNPAFQSVQMYDLERLEVLRGPQGTLYGKNTTGGTVNFTTKKPDFEDAGYLTLGYGSYARKEFLGGAETSLIDDVLAIRVAGTWKESDGWKENKLQGQKDTNGIDEWGGRITLLYQPNDQLEMVLRLSTSESNPVNYGYHVNAAAGGAGGGLYELFNNPTLGLPGALGVTPPAGAAQTSYQPAPSLGAFEIEETKTESRLIKNSAAALTINWDISNSYTLTAITSWDDGEFFSPEGDGTPQTIFGADYDADATQLAQDLRITSNHSGPFNFISGIYFAEEEAKAPVTLPLYLDLDLNVDGSLDYNDCLDPLLFSLGAGTSATPAAQNVETALAGSGLSLADLAGLGCQASNSYTQIRTSLATYFDGRYDINDSFTLRVGLRYTEDKSEIEDYSAALYGSDNILVSPTITQASLPQDRFTDREWTGKVGIDYRIDNAIMLYASFSRGYRSGAFNGQAFFDPAEMMPVSPEFVDAIEVGFKSQWLDNRVRLNGAAFHYDYRDQQFLNIDSETAVQQLANVDASSINGFELELTTMLTESLTLNSGLGWLNTEVEKGELSGINIEGNELPQAPEWNFNVSLDYSLEVGDKGTLLFHLDSSWVDQRYFDIYNSASIAQDDYWLSNGRITFEAADAGYSVSLWVKNIENKVYVTKPFDLLEFANATFSHIGAPRMAGIEGTIRF